MGVRFEGFDELAKALDNAEKRLPGARDKFLMQEAELLRGRAARLTPVDTGRLRAAWKRSGVSGGSVDIFNNTEYAAHQEYGHRVKIRGKFTGKFIKGKHMLRDAFRETEQAFPADAEAILRGLLP